MSVKANVGDWVKYLLAPFIVFIIMWMVCYFITAQLNFFNWSEQGRVFFIFVYFFIVLLIEWLISI